MRVTSKLGGKVCCKGLWPLPAHVKQLRHTLLVSWQETLSQELEEDQRRPEPPNRSSVASVGGREMRQLPWAYGQVTQHACKRGAVDSGGAGVRATMGLVERKRDVYSSRKRAWSGVQKRKWLSPPRDFWFLHPRLGLNPVKKKMPSRWQHQITAVKQGCKAKPSSGVCCHCTFLGGISFSHP